MRSSLHAFRWSPAWFARVLTLPLMWGDVGEPVFFVISGYVIHRRQARLRLLERMASRPAP